MDFPGFLHTHLCESFVWRRGSHQRQPLPSSFRRSPARARTTARSRSRTAATEPGRACARAVGPPSSHNGEVVHNASAEVDPGELAKLRHLLLDAAAILRARPSESVLHSVAQSPAALPKITDDPAQLSIDALPTSASESLRAVAAVHWAARGGTGTEGSDALGSTFAHDPAPLVRRSLASELQQTATKVELAPRSKDVLHLLLAYPLASIRRAARNALEVATTHTEAKSRSALEC